MFWSVSRAVAMLVAAVLLAACGSTPPVIPTASATIPLGTEAPTSGPTTDATTLATPSQSPTPEATPTGTPAGPDREFVSDDGQLTVLVPAGAIAADETLSVVTRGQSDLPLELLGVEVRNAFYEIGPAALEFNSPVRLQRAARLRDLDIDLAQEGLPLLVPALRSSAAAWSWLDSPTLVVEDRSLVVSGDAVAPGLLFAFGGRDFTKLEWSVPDRVVPVGSTFTLLVSLGAGADEGSSPVLGAIAPVAAPEIVESVSTSDSDGTAAEQEFRCVAAGEAPVGVSYSVTNLFADSVLFRQLGLGPASTNVTVTQTVTCTDDATPLPTTGPTESPGSSPPSL